MIFKKLAIGLLAGILSYGVPTLVASSEVAAVETVAKKTYCKVELSEEELALLPENSSLKTELDHVELHKGVDLAEIIDGEGVLLLGDKRCSPCNGLEEHVWPDYLEAFEGRCDIVYLKSSYDLKHIRKELNKEGKECGGIPKFLVFKNGEVVYQRIGFNNTKINESGYTDRVLKSLAEGTNKLFE